MMVPNPSRVISSMDQGSDEDEILVVAFAVAFVFTAAAAAAADCSTNLQSTTPLAAFIERMRSFFWHVVAGVSPLAYSFASLPDTVG